MKDHINIYKYRKSQEYIWMITVTNVPTIYATAPEKLYIK